MTAVERQVLGVPAPQGSKRAFVVAGKANLVEAAGERHKAWRGAVAEAFAGAGVVDSPVCVAVTFLMPRTKAIRSRSDVPHTVRPDIDKLVRATLDGLVDSGVIDDDSRVVSCFAVKRYANLGEATGATIRVAEDR